MGTNRKIIEAGLQAIAGGRISVESVLRQAARDPAFLRWLDRETGGAREPRRLEVERRQAFPAAVVRRATASAARRFERHGAVGVAWGAVEKRGRGHGHPGVIVLVPAKRRPEHLAEHALIPDHIDVRHRGVDYRIPVDVQELARGRKHARSARPGHLSMVVVGARFGSVSAVMTRKGKPSVVVSGHLAGKGAVVTARLGNGTELAIGEIKAARNDALVDGARVDGIAAADVALLVGPAATIRDLQPDDLNIVVTVHRAQGNGDVDASIDGIGVPAQFEDPADPDDLVLMTGLIKLEKTVTRHGDSGAPVVDSNRRLIGFVIGSADGHTYVIPARRVLDALA